MKNLPSSHSPGAAQAHPSRQQGVAILAVLALLTLMTALAVSFLRMTAASSAADTSKAERERADGMRWTVTNLVTAQLSEANRLVFQNGNAGEVVSWTTQPGAIRTYSNTNPANNRLFKLYSSAVPQITGIAPGSTAALLGKIEDDLATDWRERPDEFTDLNLPVLTGGGEPNYPIADPGLWNGNRDSPENVEGFTYGPAALTKSIGGVDAAQGRLPMPARWIYQLQDGTLGVLTRDRKFQPLDPNLKGALTRENPITGRMAWWADDESCKINLNTASVPAVWDTPRTTSLEDVWLAKTQPLSGEWQRCPGHPATVDLSAVFFPGRRFTGTDGSWTMPVGASMRGPLSLEEADLIWSLTPFISGKKAAAAGEAGTLGGTLPTPVDGTAIFSNSTHLYTSVEEAYFKAAAETGEISLDAPRQSMENTGQDPKGAFLKRLAKSRFLLTARSSSMEMTNSGYPRVVMFPVDQAALSYVGSESTAPPPSTVSPYDVTLGVAGTLGNKTYFFRRREPTTYHQEFINSVGGLGGGVFKYVKQLSMVPLAGYPDGFPGSVGGTESSASASVPAFGGFAGKYPAGFNPTTGAVFQDSGVSVVNGQTLTDASDRSQILMSMLDFVMGINMQPAFVSQSSRSDGGFGQTSRACGCNMDYGSLHASALSFSNNTWRAPKGEGRLVVPAEIAMVVNVAAKKQQGTVIAGDWDALVNLMATHSQSRQVAADNQTDGSRYIVEVGFIISAFNPKIGWSPVVPNLSLAISTIAGSTSDPRSPAGNDSVSSDAKGDVLPMFINLDGARTERLRLCGVQQASWASNTARLTSVGLIPFGGMQGPRAAISSGFECGDYRVAICSPLCIRVFDQPDGSVPVPLQADPEGVLRIMISQRWGAVPDITSAADLRLPPSFTSRLVVPLTGVTLSKQALNFANGTAPFPSPNCAVRSLVIPHGDYRQASPLRLDQDLYVAHARTGWPMAHSFYEANEVPALRQVRFGSWSPTTMINQRNVPNYAAPGTGRNLSGLPLPRPDIPDLRWKATLLDKTPDPDLAAHASRDSARREIFSFGRRDGHGLLPKRGSSDPDETGDFDNGPGAAEDGPYMNHPDEGDRRNNGGIPYFTMLTKLLKPSDGKPAQCLSPNFLVRSPVDFGSIPTGLQCRVPWQTLRFRPDPGMNDPAKTMRSLADNPPDGLPFANFCGPRDHFFLDMFWMPVIEPWGISTPGCTQGTINLNQQIFPYLYINRTTALHALFRSERLLAIPNEAAEKYKKVGAAGAPDNPDPTYRHFINAGETVKQFLTRWRDGRDPEGLPLAFNTFRSASELCELWLVPDKNGNAYDGAHAWDLSWTIGKTDAGHREGFWADHRLTGDNSRERPYANLYPRVTVRSNVFRLHLITQALQTPRSSVAGVSSTAKSASVRAPSGVVGDFMVTGEWCGSCLIERTYDPLDVAFRSIDYTNLKAAAPDAANTPRLEKFHSFVVRDVKLLEP